MSLPVTVKNKRIAPIRIRHMTIHEHARAVAANWVYKVYAWRGKSPQFMQGQVSKLAEEIEAAETIAYEAGLCTVGEKRIAGALRAAGQQEPHPAQMALEHDRTQVAEHVTAMKNTLQNYAWLLDGRGSYEWDDDRYRLEFQTVCVAMQKHIEVLARIAADWSNCPKKWEDVQAARAGQQERPASRLSEEQVQQLVSQVCTAAALFTMAYEKAKSDGGYLSYGLDSKVEPIIRSAFQPASQPVSALPNDAEENLADYLLRTPPPKWDYNEVLQLAKKVADGQLSAQGASPASGGDKPQR